MGTRPNLFISLMKQDDDTWIAFGSDKVNFLEFERYSDFQDITSCTSDFKYVPYPANYTINGETLTIATAAGSSPLSALGSLLDHFREEEKKETIEKEKRKADLERFGGSVDEELIRKIVRWRKKQEKKRQQELEYDEWDFY